VARHEHPLGLRRHASKRGDDEREKKYGLGHVEPLERNEMKWHRQRTGAACAKSTNVK
jgi:hypothetical protein